MVYAHPRRSLAHRLGTVLRLSSEDYRLSQDPFVLSQLAVLAATHTWANLYGLWPSSSPTGRRCGTPTLLESGGSDFSADQIVGNLMSVTDPNEDNMIFSRAGSIAQGCGAMQNRHSWAVFCAAACPVLRGVARPVVSGWCQLLRIRQEESLCTLPICCDGASALARVVSRASPSSGRDYTRSCKRTARNTPSTHFGE